jgi:hypothetical protein
MNVLAVATFAGAATAGSTVTGFGATNAAWNRTHTADHDFASGAVYNADTSLPRVNGHAGAHYTQVMHENGHVVGYDYHFANLPISVAKANVLRTQLPRDVKVVWFVTKGLCAQMMVRSRILGHALGSRDIGDKAGSAMVEFGSGSYGGSTYSARAVDDALFILLPLMPRKQAPGC